MPKSFFGDGAHNSKLPGSCGGVEHLVQYDCDGGETGGDAAHRRLGSPIGRLPERRNHGSAGHAASPDKTTSP
ncbi:hypothetical protein A5780_02210 [Nocardia sp. 852002-20019_SCH5090214]|nr:hypothetical protein A5780_02210 [Nocardia sp. 852002-20019_SCH5090214]